MISPVEVSLGAELGKKPGTANPYAVLREDLVQCDVPIRKPKGLSVARRTQKEPGSAPHRH